MKRPLFVFTAVLCIGLIARPFLFTWAAPPGYWITTVVLGILLALVFGKSSLTRWGLDGQGSGEFLCDSCKFNDARYCSRRERPNATSCPDYKQR